MKFLIEQIAIAPPDAERAIVLLKVLGLSDWARDTVCARGQVFGDEGANRANLSFNYDAAQNKLEFEVLDYIDGPNWMQKHGPSASHLGMHCTAAELAEWREIFAEQGVKVAQEVLTESHTNPVIAGQRWYQYVIFDTRAILGIDIKLIVRLASPPVNSAP